MVHICHVLSDLDPSSGGTVAALAGLAIAQHRLGWRVSVLSTESTDRRVARRLRDAGVEVVEIPVRSRFRSARLFRAAALTLAQTTEVFHVHALWEEIQHQVCVVAQQRRIPYIISPHGMLDPWSLSQGRLKKRAYLAVRLRRHLNRAVAIHCTTQTEARLLQPLGLRRPSVVIPNGIDLDEFEHGMACSDASCFLERFPEAIGQKIILFLSRLHPKKGLDLLLPAFAEAEIGSAVLVLAGPGDVDYIAEQKSLASARGIEERVIFTGMLHGPERVAALRAAHVFVLPSYQENFGISVIESLAAGTPVIISDQVNLCEELADSGVARVVKTSVVSVREALQNAVRDDIGPAGENLCLQVSRQYSFDAIADQWKGFIGDVAAGKDGFSE